MTQNIYDDETFFEAYGHLERSIHGLDGAPEWPALQAMLPELAGLRILDLGCGYGWFCRFARQREAAHVLGLDISERMLKRARDTSHDDRIVYRRADLDEVELAEGAFDLAYSSLAFHYVIKWPELVQRIHAALVPGGRLVFSIEHPIVTASRRATWLRDASGPGVWPVDHYFDEGPRSTHWLVDGVVKQHRTLGTYFSTLRHAGFAVSHLEDWRPTAEQVEARPEWATELERPQFLLVSCVRERQRT